MTKFLGIALIVLALGIGIVPHYTDCYSQGKVLTLANGNTQPMKCHWSAQAEVAVAVPLGGVGIMMTAGRRKGTIWSLSSMGILLGATAIALPNGIIGTCSGPTMFCNTAMKPALNVLGALTIVGGGVAIVLTRKNKD
jgi:hypothetical protein